MKVIWHHSGGTELNPCASTQGQNVEIIDEWHKQKWPGFTSKVYKNNRGEFYHCGYHMVIDLKNRKITQTRGFSEEGAHTIGMNKSSIGVLIIGNYDWCSGDQIKNEDYDLIVEAWERCKRADPRLRLSDNVSHRKYATKSCYGNRYNDSFIQRAIQSRTNEGDRVKLLKILIDLLEQKIALLTQLLTGKRLSAREIK